MGAFAEYVCAREDRVAPKPATLSFEAAAAVPTAAVTALQALRDHGHLQPDQAVLINGASGVSPNEGIRRSALNAVIVGPVIGVLVGLLMGLIIGLTFWLGITPVYGPSAGQYVALGAGPSLGLLVGLIAVLMVGLSAGGEAVIRHGVLRWQLRRAGVVPSHLVRFLDYGADHVLLQKIGGGYRFIHVLLRDYFADLSIESEKGEGSGAHQSPAPATVEAASTGH